MFHATQRVRRGATLLDRERPGWADEINTRTLDVRFTEVCPLGQLYGDYEDGLDALHLHFPWQYGFIFGPLSWLFRKANNPMAIIEDVLTNDAWLAEIRARREADAIVHGHIKRFLVNSID
jgi:hypothetical protein